MGETPQYHFASGLPNLQSFDGANILATSFRAPILCTEVRPFLALRPQHQFHLKTLTQGVEFFWTNNILTVSGSYGVAAGMEAVLQSLYACTID